VLCLSFTVQIVPKSDISAELAQDGAPIFPMNYINPNKLLLPRGRALGPVSIQLSMDVHRMRGNDFIG
jgi:hypothetical protein